MNIKKLLAIAYFNTNKKFASIEHLLDNSRSQFLNNRVYHGVASCALAKA